MATRHKIQRTTDGWWLVMSRRWLWWRRDEFMFSSREPAEDRLRDLKEGNARLAFPAHPEPSRQPGATLRPRRRLQIVPR